MPNPNLNDDDPLTWYLKIPWVYRLDITVGLLALAVAMVTPWDQPASMEGNVLFGPLWFLLSIPSGLDLDTLLFALLFATLIPGGLLLMIGAVLFRPSVVTAIVSGFGLFLWVQIGFILAMNASV